MIRINRRFTILTALAAFCIFTFAGCGSEYPLSDVEKATRLDIGNASVIESTDSHDNFLGDGTLFVSADCSSAPLTDQIQAAMNNNSGWRELPLTDTLARLMIGYTDSDGQTYEPIFSIDNTGEPMFPEIENGYRFFLDRSSGGSSSFGSGDGSSDAEDIDAAYISNFTFAMYDTDNDMLYYCEIDR